MANIGGVFNDTTLGVLTNPGQQAELRLTPYRALHVNIRTQAGLEAGTVSNPFYVTGTGGGAGFSLGDLTAFAVGVSPFVPGGGVFNDGLAAITSGLIGELRMTAFRAQHVNIRNNLGNALLGTQLTSNSLPVTMASDQPAINVNIASGGGSGFSIVDNSSFTQAVSALVPTGGVFNDALTTLASGVTGQVRITSARSMHANLRTATGTALIGTQFSANSLPVVLASDQATLNVSVVSGGGAGFSVQDGSTFTAGTSQLVPTGGVFNDGVAGLTSGNVGEVRMTQFRGIHTNLRNASGNEMGVAGSPLRVDPTGTTTQPVSGTVTATQGTAAAGVGAWPFTITDTTNAVVKPGDAANNAMRVNIIAGLPAATGTSQQDNSTFTQGAGLGTPIFGLYTLANTSPISGQAAAVRISSSRTLLSTLCYAADGSSMLGAQASSQSFPVVLATDQPAVSIVGNVGSGSTDSGNPVKIGGVANTANPAAVANGQRVNASFDPLGKQIVRANGPRGVFVNGNVSATTTVSTLVLAAGSAGVFNDLTKIVITNSSATATVVDILSGATVVMSLALAANGGAVIDLSGAPLAQPVSATAWNVRANTAVTALYAFFQAVQVTA